MLAGILAMSSYVHLWNVAGFPDIFFDEGVYMRRAINVLETGNPQEGWFYDHPYWGQLVLAGFLKIAGFPGIVEESLEFSYAVPRLLMGAFAVFDTFLVCQIADKKFGKRVALIAATLFAAMPFTWVLRWILLDTILLPFLLSSILLAVYSKDSKRQNLLIAGSAVLLGLSIFTKITAVTMIPLVGYIVYSNTRRPGSLIKVAVPAVLIPSIWPVLSAASNRLDYWLRDVLWQAGRGTGSVLVIIEYLFRIDPVTVSLAFASFAFAAYARNPFLVIWFAPFLLFVSAVGFLQYFHFLILFPVACISIAVMADAVLGKIKNTKIENVAALTVFAVAGFGLASTGMLINADLTGGQFEAMDLLINNFDGQDATLLASPVYTWVLTGVHDRQNVMADYADVLFMPVPTKKVMLVADSHFMVDMGRGQEIEDAYDSAGYAIEIDDGAEFNTPVRPYGGAAFKEDKVIELRTNWDLDWKR